MWKSLGLAGAALFGALLCAFPAFVWMNHGDPAYDDSHLRLAAWDLRPEEDGIALLTAAAADIWWPENTRTTPERLLGADAAHAALRTELLRRNREALGRFPDVPETARFQVGPQEPDSRVESQWWRLAQLLALRAVTAARAGRPADAYADAARAMDWGQRVRGARGADLFRAAIGEAMVQSGRLALVRSLAFLSPDPAREREWLAALPGEAIAEAQWRALLAAEYVWMAGEVVDAAAGELVGAHGAPARGLLPTTYLLKPNATRRLFAERTGRLQATAGLPCAAAFEEAPPFGAVEKLRTVFGPNSLGRILFRISHANTAATLRCRAETDLAATRTALALRIWESERGALPAELGELVPDLLADTPRDAFDGEPLRYAPARRQLWSVGRNLADEAGGGDDLAWSLPEPPRVTAQATRAAP